MSDAPVLTKFTRLSEFVQDCGERPSQDSLHTYLKRLKEQGHDITTTAKKAVACGVKISKEVMLVRRDSLRKSMISNLASP